MQVSIRDADALRAISPAALAAYAHARGWHQGEPYRTHSSVYVGDNLPDIIIPRTTKLGDYASAVGALVKTFAQVINQDELAVYRHLATADRDIIRIRAAAGDDGSIGIEDGVRLVSGARDLLLATACSLGEPRNVYRVGANREATDLMKRMRLGQTDQGSFAVTLLTPEIAPAISTLLPDSDDRQAPIARRLTRRLIGALAAAREASESVATGDGVAFGEAVAEGVSANLCEALVQIIEPFTSLDIEVLWACTRPSNISGAPVRFGKADAPILREVARSFRDRATRPSPR